MSKSPRKEVLDLSYDETAKVGHFARVVKGEDAGTYVVVADLQDNDVAVVRSRDSDHRMFSVPLEYLRPDRPGRR